MAVITSHDRSRRARSGNGQEKQNQTQIASALLKAAIREGRFQPGERLNEIRLAEEFGVSRTPLRAALQELAGAGHLIYQRNRGYCLREYSDSEISIAYEARALLEGLAGRLAAERGVQPEMKAALERNIVNGEQAVAADVEPEESVRLFRDVNAEFHELLLQASNSDLLRELIDACHKVPIAAPQNIESYSSRHLRIWQDDHCNILEAIFAREPVRAERLMREHVSGLRSLVLLARKRDR